MRKDLSHCQSTHELLACLKILPGVEAILVSNELYNRLVEENYFLGDKALGVTVISKSEMADMVITRLFEDETYDIRR